MGQAPTGCLGLARCLMSSTSRAPHTSIRSGVQRARCCGPQAVEGRLIQSPPPPHLVAREDPHRSLPRGAPTNSLPHSLSSPPLAVKVHFGRRNAAGEVGEGALCLLHTHRHSLLALAGIPRWLGSSPPSVLLRALRPHMRSQPAPLSHSRLLLCRAAGRTWPPLLWTPPYPRTWSSPLQTSSPNSQVRM